MTVGFDKPLYVLPFDHRGTFQTKMFGWKGALTAAQTAEIAAHKQVIYDGFQAALAAGVPKEKAGILVDEQFGTAILRDAAERGILLCGSGVGASVAANKLPGVRAGLCHDAYSAHQGVEHDAMNVLVMGARVIGPGLANELVRAFLGASYSGEERHERRLAKVRALEADPTALSRATSGGKAAT